MRGIRRDTAETLGHELDARLAPAIQLASRWIDRQAEQQQQVQAQIEDFSRGLHTNRLTSAWALGALLVSGLVLVHGAIIGPRRRLQEELAAAGERQAQLASLSELASGVAHEIRNPLTAIKFRLFSLKKSLGFSDNEDFQTIRGEIDRLERIAQSVLQFARPPELQPREVQSAELFEHIRSLLAPEVMRRHGRIQIDSSETIHFRADRPQLEQVLINLCQNAAESMSGGGTITLRARGGIARLANGPEAVALLEVADTGPGIPVEIQKRLFSPFFSTREGGTGLGLAIASRIIEQHGGRMHFSTTKGRGTTFTVVLPSDNHDESANSTH